MTSEQAVHAACMQVLDDFMAALKAHDAQGMDRTMHFPHIRLAGGTLRIYEAPGHNPMDLFMTLKMQDDWAYSSWGERQVVQFSDTKAHVALSYTRFRSDGSVIGTYKSLYILTKVGDTWGIQMRSSFGP